MRIIMPTFERIEWMPPTIDLLRKLDAMGHHVVCITLYPDEYLLSLGLENVDNVALSPNERSLQNLIPYIKGVSGVLFRIDNVRKKLVGRKLKKAVAKELEQGGVLWVVNEMTAMVAGTSFLKNRKYAFTVYELHEKKLLCDNVRRAAKGAGLVIVPQAQRAKIMKERYGLRETPVVLPNKSRIEESEALSAEARNAIKLLCDEKEKGTFTVLYMGGINPERPLEGFLDAISDRPGYKLAVMGRKSPYLDQLTEKYGDKILYIGAFPPPEHLAVAKHADAGLLNYVSLSKKQSLNALYCAPNKIYEYTGLGLPVMGNDIPGLRYEIENSRCGRVVDYSDKSSVMNALENIRADYDGYSERARAYYAATDTDEILKEILEQLQTM